MSSAAVLAVYAAGYVRTQTAADQFAAEAAGRRPVLPAPAPTPPSATGRPTGERTAESGSPAGTGHLAAASRDGDGAIAAAPGPPSPPPPAAARATAPVAAAQASPVALAGGERATSATPPPNALAPATPPSAPPRVATDSNVPAADIEPSAAPSHPAETTSTASVGNVALAPAEAPAAAPAAPRYKDGIYTGWGTSRHGDIQARVVIEGGRITSATIAQCLTRWPCSWIEALPAQVVQRQSPETDFVSGATQSTNAFYYGVVQALGKASLP